MMKKVSILVASLSLAISSCVMSATLRPEDTARLQLLSQQTGVPMSELTLAAQEANYRQPVLDAFTRTAESKPWYQYRELFITDKRIQDGANFWRAHAAALRRAEQQYNVPASVIVAIIGVETFYGTQMGKHPILDSLYTLAFYHPTRTDFFSKEFVNYVKLGNQQGWDLRIPLGSYAGAMGMGQFMPSSYLAYAVDFDQDGHKDLFNDADDAIGSVANYFHVHGWIMGQPVTTQASLTQPAAASLATPRVDLKQTWSQLTAQGVRSTAYIAGSTPVSLIQLEQPGYSEYWVAQHNFYVITRYNKSPLYAMAVYDLSKLIEKQYYGR